MAGSEYYENPYEKLAELTSEDSPTKEQPNYMYGSLDEQYDPRYANIESLGLNPQNDSDVELYNKMQLAIQEHKESKGFRLDPNVQSVISKYKNRARVGFEKYGTNTTRTDIDLQGWLTHLQEELMDATIYIERLKKDIK
jgi:hypothetical protein